MMADAELVKACALSIGAKISSRLSIGGLMITTENRRSPHRFDPLNNANDAMRAAIHHQMGVFAGSYGAEVVCEKIGIDSVFCENKEAPLLAICYAITTVAAKIYLNSINNGAVKQ